MSSTGTDIEGTPAVRPGFFGEHAQELDSVVSRYLPMFYKRAFQFLGNTTDAEDAVQDALLSAYKHLGQFRGQAQLSTWLTTIVTNAARMQLRRRRGSHLSLDEQQGEDGLTLSERLLIRGRIRKKSAPRQNYTTGWPMAPSNSRQRFAEHFSYDMSKA